MKTARFVDVVFFHLSVGAPCAQSFNLLPRAGLQMSWREEGNSNKKEREGEMQERQSEPRPAANVGDG